MDTNVDSDTFIFTTLRWDPTLPLPDERDAADASSQFYLLQNHADRLADACVSGYLGNSALTSSSIDSGSLAKELSSAVLRWHNTPGNGSAKSLRIKHRIYGDGMTMTECWPVPRLPRASCFPPTLGTPQTLLAARVEWTIVLDTEPTKVSCSTKCKTSDRQAYDRARKDAGIPSLISQQECLLYDHDGHIIDASICTPYFFRDGVWLTPSAECGGQQGTTRRWALEHDRASEGTIEKSRLESDQIVWLSNAVRGFFAARFVQSFPEKK